MAEQIKKPMYEELRTNPKHLIIGEYSVTAGVKVKKPEGLDEIPAGTLLFTNEDGSFEVSSADPKGLVVLADKLKFNDGEAEKIVQVIVEAELNFNEILIYNEGDFVRFKDSVPLDAANWNFISLSRIVVKNPI